MGGAQKWENGTQWSGHPAEDMRRVKDPTLKTKKKGKDKGKGKSIWDDDDHQSFWPSGSSSSQHAAPKGYDAFQAV